MTQQDMIFELNKMVIGYNITWDKVKYDADKAIMKINAHLGAEYPMMSDILLSPNHRYTIRYKNADVPIFPKKYILTVVLPFIASEVLARDEEFTTIYNKYVMDVENGLFEMFQNEFNKVPLVFRQDSDVGVFFERGTKEYKHKLHKEHILPEFKFNVYYHVNNNSFKQDRQFTIDVNRYAYGSTVNLLPSTVDEFIEDIYVHKFTGWMLNPSDTVIYNPGDLIENIKGDVHLYACWDSECILNTDALGDVSIVPEYKSKVTYLTIPTYVRGRLVKSISENFASDTNLIHVELPKTNLTIYSNAFDCPTLQELVIPEYDYLRESPNITIYTDAIINTSIASLHIPYSVRNMSVDAVLGVPNITCEVTRASKPTTWMDDWCDLPESEIKWGVRHG